MRDSSLPARLTRSWRARLLAAALLLSVALVAGCTGSSGTTASGASAATARGAATPASSPAGASPATTSGSVTAAGPATTVPAGPPAEADSSCPLQQSPCYSPHQFRIAYGIQPLLDGGIDGRGVTVTVLSPTPSAGDATDIRQDLAAFNHTFGLPAARIQIVTTLAGAAAPWQADSEEVGDFEVIHAVAPAATLRVVLFPSTWSQGAATATADMLAGLRLAVSGTDVASISWGLGEHYFTRAQAAEMHSILLAAAAHHVTVLASSGDNGAFSDDWFGGRPVEEVELPASDPLVLGVGGTTLTAKPSGAYLGETAWAGAGGGFSHLYARPAYQDGVRRISAMRGVPDVAADAGHPGPPVVFAGGSIETPVGTSGSTPLWGGVIALADQYAHHDLGFVNPAIYRIGRSPSYHKAFHDITTGNNDVTAGSATVGYQAGPGWDPVTGWGSPDAKVLVPLLARFASSREA
ncbi:MAG: S8 family serine peptidase [Streptosporangiaceae bacterium]